jgi:MFS family permease
MTGFLARIYAFKFFDAFIVIFPLYAVMFVDAGLTPVQIAVALTMWSAVAFVVEVPAGVIADRFPRKWVLALAQLARAAGFVVWWIYPHFWGFLFGLMLWGVKSGFTSGTFEALLYDELKAQDRAGEYPRIIGRARAAQSIAVLLASLGAAATTHYGYGLALALSLASIAVAIVAAAFLPPVPKARDVEDRSYLQHLREGLSEGIRHPSILGIVAFSALVLALGQALGEFWPVFGAKAGLGRPAIALFVGAQSALEAVANTQAHRFFGYARRWFYIALIGAGLVLGAAAAIFAPWSMALLVLYSGTMKVVDTVFEGRLQQAIGSANRATVGSLKGFAAQIGVSGLYLMFGPLAQATSYRVAFMACGAATLAVGAGYLAFNRRAALPGEAGD